MACSSGCKTGPHATYGECLRAKSLRTNYIDTAQQKKGDKELAAYRDARKQGIQPKSTRLADTQQAVQISDKTGTAFQA